MISCALEPNNATLSMTRSMSWAFVRQLNFPVNDGDKIRASSLGPSFAETLLGVLSRYDSTVNPRAASASSTVAFFFLTSSNT